MPLEGLQLGRYRLLRLIGSGGMGEVYLAEDPRIDQQVAIKVIRGEVAPYPDEEASKQISRLFIREVKAIARLDHPNILPLYDYGEEVLQDSSLTYIVMPFRKEGSLASWLKQRPTNALLSLEDIAYLVQQATDALQHAHDNNIIHQDVKSSNFLIRSRPKRPNRPDLLLADFGIAKSSTATSTASQSVRGTPASMPPEQWDGQPVPATDQYALSIMVYQLLTGRLPFQGGPGQVMRQHFSTPPPPPSTFRKDLSPAIDAVFLRALEKKPEARFPSIDDFGLAFQQAVQWSGPLRSTLVLSQEDTQVGTTRTLTLPGGRKITVNVPPHVQDGYVMRLDGEGEEYYEHGPRGPLLLTVSFQQPRPTAYLPETKLTRPSGTNTPTDSQTLQKTSLASSRPELDYGTDFPPPTSQYRLVSTPKSQHLVDISNPGRPIQFLPDFRKGRRRRLLVLVSILVLLVLIGAGFLVNHLIVVASNPDPYPPTNGSLALFDSLQNSWNGLDWPSDSSNCFFSGGAYHVNAVAGQVRNCFTANFSNLAFEAQMTILKGDCGGLAFRAAGDSNQLYAFRVCQDGNYTLDNYVDFRAVNSINLLHGTSSAITRGLNQTNILAVVVNGSTIDLYVNHVKINSITDGAYSQGGVGLLALTGADDTEVAYTNAKVWTL